MPDSERKLAELLTASPGLLATHSATELAAIAGSSKAAVTRFIQRLGYDGFAEARREAREAQRWGAPTFQSAAALGEAADEAFGDHLRRDIDNLAQTYEQLASGIVEPSLAALAAASRVLVVGYRNSYALALYLARQLVLLKGNVVVLPQPGQTVGEDLAGLGSGDILIVLAFRRRVPIVAEIARHARRRGVPVLVLADSTAAAGEIECSWRITCETRGSSQFDSYVAPMSVLNLYVSALARRPEIAGSKRLRDAERLHDFLDEL